MSERAVVLTAKELVAQGWAKGQWRTRDADGTSTVCLVGAFLEASVQGGGWPWHSWRALDELLRARGFEHPGEFNDADETTVDDVLELLEELLVRVEHVETSG